MRETQSFNSSIKKEKALQFAVLFLARLEGLEPPTYWFVASHSIQLSYKRIHIVAV